jgi:NAD(P)-dependent dehydrogenase (short-subunit alcohol dehydrogenase family)
MKLTGKVAIVTGAARHIGATYARRLAAEGAAVVVADILNGGAVVREIEEAGGDAVFMTVDVSKEKDAHKMAAETVARFGRIDVLVNNAAVFVGIKRRPFHDISVEEWDRVAAVNIKGPFLCAKAVFPIMKKQGYGKIINISSNTVMLGTENFLHYVTSKAALIGLTRALAREVGDSGVRVNAIAPGLVEHEGMELSEEIRRAQLTARTLKRAQRPGDLAGALVYLASSDSDFVTGQTLVVDGGRVFQ